MIYMSYHCMVHVSLTLFPTSHASAMSAQLYDKLEMDAFDALFVVMVTLIQVVASNRLILCCTLCDYIELDIFLPMQSYIRYGKAPGLDD